MENLNLDNVKTGDEITTLRIVNGKIEASGLLKVGEWSEKHSKFLLVSPDTGKVSCTLPVDGVGYDFMSRREKPDYYYSANPAHIKKAKAKINRARKIRETKEKLADKKRAIYSPLLETYRDNEECYTLSYLDPDILQKLTVEQLETFVSWLK